MLRRPPGSTPTYTLFPDPTLFRTGERVRVPFGRQRAIGIVAAQAESSDWPRARLKSVTQAIDTTPLWDDATFGVLRWAADYYHHPLGDVRSEEDTSELQSLMRNSYAVFWLKKRKT